MPEADDQNNAHGEDEDEEMEDGGQEQQANQEDGREGLTARQLFKLLRGEYNNTAALATDLLQEAGLQERLRIIAGVLKPLHAEYTFDFAMQKGGQNEMMSFSALRADFHFYDCVAEILEHMQNPSWVQALDLCPSSDAHDGDFNMEGDFTIALKADAALLEVLFAFSIHLASARCWSQAFLCFLFPYCFSAVYLPDTARRAVAMERLSEIASALLDLEEYCSQNKDKYAQELLEDLSTNRWQLTREMLQLGEACGWDPRNRDMQRLCWACFAGPASTKDVLEQVFNWLKDSLRSSKNKVLAGWTKYLYVLASPYTAASGIQTMLPSVSDFSDFLHANPKIDNDIASLHPFHAKTSDLDKKLFPSAEAVSQIRPAGLHVNRRGSAAMSFLLEHRRVGRSLSQLPTVWQGWVPLLKM